MSDTPPSPFAPPAPPQEGSPVSRENDGILALILGITSLVVAAGAVYLRFHSYSVDLQTMVENTGSGADDIVGYAFLFGFPLLIVEPILMRIVVIVAVILGAASLIAGIVGLRNSKSTTSRVRNALGMALGVAGSLLSLYFQHEFFSIIQ